ncbi:MAG: hypothetical protein AAF658_05120, partial [Myxococcota bacterium]
MDLSWLPFDQRQQFLERVETAYADISGRSFRADVGNTFGRTIEIEGPNGRRVIESRAMVLAQRGVLTGAEKIIYGAQEPTSLFGLMPRREFSTIVEGLNETAGAAAYLTPMVLADMIGMTDYDPRDPAAVYDEVLKHIDDPTVKFSILRALPSPDDIPRAETELRAFVVRPSDARLAARMNHEIERQFGVTPNDFLHRIFGDQVVVSDEELEGLGAEERIARLEAAAGAQRQVQSFVDRYIEAYPTLGDFVRHTAVPPDEMVGRIREVNKSMSAGPIMRFINRTLGNEHEVVLRDLEELAAIAAQGEVELQETGEISQATRARAQAAQERLQRNLPNLQALTASRRAFGVQAVSAAVLVVGAAQGLGPGALALYNSLARVSTNAVLWNHNTFDLVAEGARGAFSGFTAGTVGEALPSYDPSGSFNLANATEYIFEVAEIGGLANLANSTFDSLSRPETHLWGTTDALLTAGGRGVRGYGTGYITSGVVAGGMVLAEELLVRDRTQEVDLNDDDVVDDGGGGPIDDPPGRTPDNPDPIGEPPGPGGEGTDRPDPIGEDPGLGGEGGNNDAPIGEPPSLGGEGGTPPGRPTQPPGDPGIIPDGDSPVPVGGQNGIGGVTVEGGLTQPGDSAPIGRPGGTEIPGNPVPTPPSDPLLDRISGDPNVGSVAQVDPTEVAPVVPDPDLVGVTLPQEIGADVVGVAPPTDLPNVITLPNTGETVVGFDIPMGITGDIPDVTGGAGEVLTVPVAGPPSAEFIELFTNAAELANLAGIQTIDKVIFVWEESGISNSEAIVGAMSTVMSDREQRRSAFAIPDQAQALLTGTDPRTALVMAVGMNGVVAESLLHDAEARGRIPVDRLEAVTERLSGLPEGYEAESRTMSEDQRRVTLLRHMAIETHRATHDREAEYQLPEGWVIGPNGSIMREGEEPAAPFEAPAADDAAVAAPVDGANPAERPVGRAGDGGPVVEPVAEPVRSEAEIAADNVETLMGAIDYENPAFAGIDREGQWFEDNFFPVLELMNG